MSEAEQEFQGEVEFIGDFEMPLDAVVTSSIPVGKDLLMEIVKSERKLYDAKDEEGNKTGEQKPYFNLQISVLDVPGENLFHKFFPTAKSLASRQETRSYKLFLDTLGLSYTVHPANNGLKGVRFIGQVRLDKDRGEYLLSKVVKAA